jgi:hypothetical protein
MYVLKSICHNKHCFFGIASHDSITELAIINQSINQSINQPTNQSINQSTNQSIHPSIHIHPSINQSINQSSATDFLPVLEEVVCLLDAPFFGHQIGVLLGEGGRSPNTLARYYTHMCT